MPALDPRTPEPRPRSRGGRATLVAFLALLAWPGPASPAPKGTKTVVLELSSELGVDARVARVVTDTLASSLQEAAGVPVIAEREILMSLGFEQRKAMACSNRDESCIAEVGGALGADFLVFGSLSKVGDVFVVSISAFDERRAVVVKRFMRRTSGATESSLLDLADEAGKYLAPVLPGSKLAESPPTPTAATPPPAGALPGAVAATAAVAAPPSGPAAAAPATTSSAPPPAPVPGRGSARLTVETDPPGLEVRVDGAEAGASPVTDLEVGAGIVEVAVANPCYLEGAQKVALKPGERRAVKLKGKVRQASLQVKAEDERGAAVDAPVELDGVKVGKTGAVLKVPVCSMRLAVPLRGYRYEEAVKLSEGKVTQVVARAPAAPAAVAPPPAPAPGRPSGGAPGYLGVQVGDATVPGAADANKTVFCVRVLDVAPGSPADLGGLKVGDLVTRLGDAPVPSAEVFVNRVGSMAAGDVARLAILRGTAAKALTVKLGRRQ